MDNNVGEKRRRWGEEGGGGWRAEWCDHPGR